MTNIITREILDQKRDWKSSEKQSEASTEMAEYNKLSSGTVQIDIEGKLVIEEVLKHKLEGLFRQMKKEALNEEEDVEDDKFTVYLAALKHLC